MKHMTSLICAVLALLSSCDKPAGKITYAMSAAPASVEFPTEGGAREVVVESELSWKVSPEEDWLTVTPASGLKGSTAVTVTAGPNFGPSRTAKLVFASPNNISSTTVSIQQDKCSGAVDPRDLPDKAGMTLKGLVLCEGQGVAGVSVSDGDEVTQTDDQGRFWLPSAKRFGYVFISVPGGYRVPVNGAYPLFWQKTTGTADEVEAFSFTLTPEKQDRFKVVASADLHLADRYSSRDLRTYREDYLPRLQEIADAGVPAYNVVLGDMTWDIYWKNYNLTRYAEEHRTLPLTTWHTIGNHDYDMSFTDDFKAERTYIDALGPVYYSFNLGKAHFVVLDDIVYRNENQSRNHYTYVDEQQLAWLRKDLSYIADNTPVFVCMHCNLYHAKGISKSGVISYEHAFNPAGKTTLFTEVLQRFKTVYLLTGDTHINQNIPPESMPAGAGNIYQHNIAAVCASWWWTTYESSNSICKDGSEGGFKVFEFNGDDISWYYQPLRQPTEKQFRSYDMNTVKAYFATNAGAAKFLNRYPDRENYASLGDDLVFINIWAWDSRWSVKVTENGTDLPVEFICVEDPLHTLSYDIPRTVENGELTSSFRTTSTHHMVKVKAGSPSSTLQITVTDPFGRVFTETMQRPKAFNTDMD